MQSSAQFELTYLGGLLDVVYFARSEGFSKATQAINLIERIRREERVYLFDPGGWLGKRFENKTNENFMDLETCGHHIV